MAVRMIPHGRRGWAKFTIGSFSQHYAILNASIGQPRNLIVPPVLSRDYEFAFAEGVRTVQITMQVPMFTQGGAEFGTAQENQFLQYLFQRYDNPAEYAIADTYEAELQLFDGVDHFTFQGVRVNRVSLSVQKGQVLVWNLELMGIQLNFGADTISNATAWGQWGASFPAPRSFRDVSFVYRDSPGASWSVFTTPVYGFEAMMMHNLTLNAPLTDDAGDNIPGAARLDAGQPMAQVSATFQGYRVNRTTNASGDYDIGIMTDDLADLRLLLGDNAGFGIRINTGAPLAPDAVGNFGAYFEIRFPRVIAENREDAQAQFGQLLRTLRFRCLGDPLSAAGADEYTTRYPFVLYTS